MSRFKVGDEVSVVHHAWSKTLNGSRAGKLVHRCDGQGNVQKYQVIAVECKIPINMSAVANTLIYNENSGDFVALNDCNLMPYVTNIGIHFIVEGQDVTAKLSDGRKREILQAHLRR